MTATEHSTGETPGGDKQEQVQRQVAVYVAITVAICLAVAGLCYGAYMFKEAKLEESNKLNNSVRSANSDIQNLEKDLEMARRALEIYQTMKNSNVAASTGIDVEVLRLELKKLKSLYLLTKLEMQMSNLSNVTDRNLQKKSFDIEHSLVTMKFSGLSDELIFSFIDHLMKALPGYAQVDWLIVERLNNLDSSFLEAVAREDYQSRVKGEIGFHWLVKKSRVKEEQPQAGGADGTAP